MGCSGCGKAGHTAKTCLSKLESLQRINSNEECSICLSKVNKPICRTKCDHTYHITCIKQWLAKNDSCPLCREKIGNIDPRNVLMILIESLMENIEQNSLLTEEIVTLYFENEILI